MQNKKDVHPPVRLRCVCPADGTGRQAYELVSAGRLPAGRRRGRARCSSAESAWKPDFRSLLPQGDELSASSQVVCGGAAELSRSAVAASGVRNVLSLREERRVIRVDASALAADE